jgi:hypothetical protein
MRAGEADLVFSGSPSPFEAVFGVSDAAPSLFSLSSEGACCSVGTELDFMTCASCR